MTEKGAYGEPWRVDHLGSNLYRLVNSKGQSGGVFHTSDPEQTQRSVACVNVLDGYDPEKLGAFLDASAEIRRELVHAAHKGFLEVPAGKADDWMVAYDALMGKVTR